MVTLTVNKILLAPGVQTPPTVDLLIAEFFGGSFTSFATGVVIDASGNVVGPLPSVSVDPTLRYTLRSINNMCAYQYDQDVTINISCPIGYTLNGAKTECYQEIRVAPTTPTLSGVASERNNVNFSTNGTFIFDNGYALDGTGDATQIDSLNTFWINFDATTSSGPFNRVGIWAPAFNDQYFGYSICQLALSDKTVYVAISSEYGATIRLNGADIVVQDVSALNAQFDIGGSVYKTWMVYPLSLPGNRLNIIEVTTFGDTKPSLGVEIYDNTAAEIIAATNYTGLNVIFSTKDEEGLPFQIANNGIGYLCPSGYSLEYCASPIACYRRDQVSPTYS